MFKALKIMVVIVFIFGQGFSSPKHGLCQGNFISGVDVEAMADIAAAHSACRVRIGDTWQVPVLQSKNMVVYSLLQPAVIPRVPPGVIYICLKAAQGSGHSVLILIP